MLARSLAHHYVTMDRWVFQQLEAHELDDVCEKVKKRLKDEGGYTAFAALCQTPGVEEREILWFLAGCEGLPGFGARLRVSPTTQLFGKSAEQLRKNLNRIREAASIIESIQRSPFGPFSTLANPFISSTVDTLRSYALLIEAAQSDFGHGTEWFLNIAKARIVIHVKHWTGDPHDKEVSGLIAAVTGKENYGQENQKSWREKYNDLASDAQLDSYTTQTPAEREHRNHEANEYLKEPGIKDAVDGLTRGFLTIYRSRSSSEK
jgi:hypothetical protein